jgi:hypothetical protein
MSMFILFIYIKLIKKVGNPTVYRTSLHELNAHTKQLTRRMTMNTLLQIYIKVRENFVCMTRYIKVGNTIRKHNSY